MSLANDHTVFAKTDIRRIQIAERIPLSVRAISRRLKVLLHSNLIAGASSALVNGKKLPISGGVAAKGYRALQHGQRLIFLAPQTTGRRFKVRFMPCNVATALV